MKNFETQLQQISSTMSEFQNRINQLGIEGVRNHEAIMAMDRKLESSLEGMDRVWKGQWRGYERPWELRCNNL